MSRRHRARIQSRLRILLLSSLMTFLIAETIWLELAHRRPRPAGVTAALAIPPLAAPAPLPRYGVIVTGDLFSEARQPSQRVVSRVALPEPSRGGALRILAIVITDTDRVALAELAGAAEPTRLRQGDRAGPYRVLAIGPETITIENNGLTEILSIPHQDSSADAPTNTATDSAPGAPSATPTSSSGFGGLSNAEQAQEINRRFLEMRASGKPDPTIAPSSPQSPAPPKS